MGPGNPLAPLPPPSRAACWAEFVKWTMGVPVVVIAALAVVWAVLWISGSWGLSSQAQGDMGTVLIWLALIGLMYPAMLFIWVSDLRRGLRAAREWEALTEAEQSAALAAPAPPVRPRKGR
jgi:hypothetical protein